MHLSSIFNFSTYQARWRLSPWVIYLLLLLCLVELTLHMPVITDHLPKPELTLWHAELIQSKLDYLKAFEATRGVDVLFIGNSTMQAGVNPQLFDLARGKQESTAQGAFNGSLEGLPPYGALMFLEIYLRDSRPTTVIYGITAQDLNSNSPWAQDVTDRVKYSPLALAEARRGLRGQLIASLLEYSNLYRYRFVLHQLLLRGGIASPPPEVYFDTRGFHAIKGRLADVPAAERGIYYNNAGVLNYSIQGEQLESLRRLIAYCADNDIRLILVNMPLADDYYGHFDSLEDYQTYLSTATELASEFEIPFWDMEGLPPARGFDDTHFADFNHLNQFGAEKLSRLLAERYGRQVPVGSRQ